MKHLGLVTLLSVWILFGCHHVKSNASATANSKKIKVADSGIDKDKIQTLIRNMLIWADSGKEIDLLPTLTKDSICVGFDFDKEKQAIRKLKETGFFADEFINNYDHIIQTLDKKIRSGEFEKWNTYELPTFSFANDVDPWCLCQDNLPWGKVEVKVVKLGADEGEFKWNWGKLDPGTDPSWGDFSYTFRVVKLNNKWKISYLEGFDYQKSILKG